MLHPQASHLALYISWAALLNRCLTLATSCASALEQPPVAMCKRTSLQHLPSDVNPWTSLRELISDSREGPRRLLCRSVCDKKNDSERNSMTRAARPCGETSLKDGLRTRETLQPPYSGCHAGQKAGRIGFQPREEDVRLCIFDNERPSLFSF